MLLFNFQMLILSLNIVRIRAIYMCVYNRDRTNRADGFAVWGTNWLRWLNGFELQVHIILHTARCLSVHFCVQSCSSSTLNIPTRMLAWNWIPTIEYLLHLDYLMLKTSIILPKSHFNKYLWVIKADFYDLFTGDRWYTFRVNNRTTNNRWPSLL